MLDLNITTIGLILLVVGLIVFIGREFQARYPQYADYVGPDKQSTPVQQARAGGFVVLDFASDLAFPGSREKAREYKKSKTVSD